MPLRLEEILASTSDTLFPEQLGNARVTIESKDCDGDTPLHVLVRRGDSYAVNLLIESGAEVNAIGDMSETPLHIAIRKENIPIVELLLSAGAKSDICSEFNKTAKEQALEKGGKIAKLVCSS
ncbi:MAG: ankyrin repeat protein [Nonlabens sp.]|jgi:ankyrin repeat protein